MANDSRSLRRQLLLWLLALLVPLLLAGAVGSYLLANHFSNLAYDRSLFRAALALADQVEVLQGRVVVDLPQKALDLLEYDKDDWIYYRITDPQGITVAGETGLALPSHPPKPGGHVYYDTQLAGKSVRAVAFALPLEGTSARGQALVQVAETRAKRDLLAEEIILAMMLPQLLIVLLAGALVHFGVSRGLAPLERLRQAFAQRSHRDLSAVPCEGAPREVLPLLHAMNDLMQRLRESIAQQQRFIADASHQMRTPLAGLQTQAEMALRENDPARIQHALERIRASTVRLSHLVSQLLALARVEPSSGKEIHWQTIDLVPLARSVCMDHVADALAKQIDLGFEATLPKIEVQGDPLMLREMLANLIDNALRYTPARGKVTVTVLQDNDQAMLAVEDTGSGIPPEERTRIFERFHRLADSPGDGCGLGLAIVREIVLAHQGEITVEHGKEGRGTRMTIRLSLPAAAG
ncbi:MAG: sensor histidine kinase [Methylophilaceae bacterium]|nr:sensor histidine kinase [Methylophilaceae bacterium]